MAKLTKRLTTLLATLVLGTTLLASGANAAVLASDAISITAGVADVTRSVTAERERPERDGDHHRRFCVRLNALLSRLVDNGVITREQKLRIMDAFNCVPGELTPTDPSATRPVPAR